MEGYLLMDEQRQEAYLNLIDALLSCHSGEEPQILNANSDLVDAGLVQTMRQVAEMMKRRGDRNAADFLIQIAGQLQPNQPTDPCFELVQTLLSCPSEQELTILKANRNLINLNLIEAIERVAGRAAAQGNQTAFGFLQNLAMRLLIFLASQDSLEILPESVRIFSIEVAESTEFITTTLQMASGSDDERNALYSFLQANLVRLNSKFSSILSTWITVTLLLETLNAEVAIELARRIAVFSYLIQRFPFGSKSRNIEIAIAGYQRALQVYTREEFPEEWAEVKNNLGIAYREYPGGNRADNLEAAIEAYQLALQVRTFERYPAKWAATQNNLGNAYRDRIRGVRAENLELAINSYQLALQVWSPSYLPDRWAAAQNNLATAYRQRILGDRAANLESAIAAYNLALQIYTCASFPEDWAMTQSNLGNSYCDRICGNRADNLEAAIAAYQLALQIYNRQEFPEQWARTQVNLGTAYHERIQGDEAKNLEAAISAYQLALQIYTPEEFPEQFAETQLNLGNVYRDHIRGDRIDNLKAAITAYQNALKICTCEAFPEQWAALYLNLGLTYIKLAFSQLSSSTRDSQQSKNSWESNLKQAINCYQEALQVHTREAFPLNHVRTSFSLGIAYLTSGEMSKAYTNFSSAIHTVELLRGEIISGEAVKQKLAEDWNDLYQSMVQACLSLAKTEPDHYIRAITYVELSKTRNLVELILSRDLYSIFPQILPISCKSFKTKSRAVSTRSRLLQPTILLPWRNNSSNSASSATTYKTAT